MERKSPKEILTEWITEKNVFGLCKWFFKTELTPTQEKIVKAIFYQESQRIVISCLTRYGKSWCVAQAILLYSMFNENKRVLIIAPTMDQTKIIRNYVSSFILENSMMADMVEVGATGIDRLKSEVSKKRITLKNGSEIMVLSAEGTGERLMGFGGDLIIKDEDCLIDYEVYQQKISRMPGDNPDSIMVSIGNPWHRNNQMYEHWTDPDFLKIHVDYKIALKEGRITKEFLEKQRKDLNPIVFKVLYEAEFPEEAEDALFRHEHIKEAQERSFQLSNPLNILGVDVARYGLDSTVLTHVRVSNGKHQLVKQHVYNKMNTMETVGKIRQLHAKNGFDRINVDVIGIGSGVFDRLDEEGLPVFGAHFGQSPIKPYEESRHLMNNMSQFEDQTRTLTYMNKKAEQYFWLARLFEEGKISIKGCDSKLIDNLRKMGYEVTSGGKTKIVDPEDGKSPDFSDSLVYACWDEEGEVVIDW